MTVRFDNATYTDDEDVGIIQPLLVLSNPSSFVETVRVISTDVTANGKVNCSCIIIIHIYVCMHYCDITGGDDYIPGPYNVTFPIGYTSALIDIYINDDDILEEDETFVVSITSFPNGTVGTPGTARITIVDISSKSIYSNECI